MGVESEEEEEGEDEQNSLSLALYIYNARYHANPYNYTKYYRT